MADNLHAKSTSGRRLRTNATISVTRTAVLALLLSFRALDAFQPQLPQPTYHGHHHTLHAKKPSQKSKSKAAGFGSGGGFGSKSKASSSSPADHSKVRSVSGHTGSGTKVLAEAANNFDRIRKLFGQTATTDIYVRSPLNDESTFWFVGKVIRTMEKGGGEGGDDDGKKLVGTVYPTEEEAIVSQKRLLLEYAKNQLRPQNMGGPYAKSLELWSAPGDSEMDVVQNKITLVHVTASTRDLREGFHVKDVGLNPEIYVGDEVKKGGLRVVRDAEGRPVKPAFEISV